MQASRMVELLEGDGLDIECLILDLRDEDDYAQYHIKTGRRISGIRRYLAESTSPVSSHWTSLLACILHPSG